MKGKIAVAVLLMGLALPGYSMGEYEMAAKITARCRLHAETLASALAVRFSENKGKQITNKQLRQGWKLNDADLQWVNRHTYYPGDDSAQLTAYGMCVDYYLQHPEVSKYL